MRLIYIIILLLITNYAKPQLVTKYLLSGNSDRVIEKGSVAILTTTTNTPTLYFSIPISTNKSVEFTYRFKVCKNDYTSCAGGTSIIGFSRGSGNILIQGNQIDNTYQGFSGTKPSYTITANTGTQSIDITVTGISGTTLLWTADYEIRYNP